MTREAIALLHEVPEDSFDVTVEPRLDDAAEQTISAAVEATRRARAAAEEPSRLQREAATTLLTKNHLTVRDAGVLLHVSPQRVSKLATTAVPVTSPATGRVQDQAPERVMPTAWTISTAKRALH